MNISLLEHRTAKALVAFRRAEGSTLTAEQYEALVDQMALLHYDLLGHTGTHYQEFCNAAGIEA